MTITLPPDVETRLKGVADRLGVDAAEYARQLIERALPGPTPQAAGPAPVDKTIELLNQWEAETATDDPEELARRREEFEEFKAGMNRNRLEMEGPNARIPFP